MYSKDNSLTLVVWRFGGKTVSMLGCSILCALENEGEAFAIKQYSVAMEGRKHQQNIEAEDICNQVVLDFGQEQFRGVTYCTITFLFPV